MVKLTGYFICIFIVLFTLLTCDRIHELDKDEAYVFARAHYSVEKFIGYYDTLKMYVAKHYLNDSIGRAMADSFIVRTIYGGKNSSYFRDSLTEDSLKIMYSQNRYIQGWDDSEPSMTVNGYVLSNLPYYSDYEYNDSIWFDDSLRITCYVNRLDNGQAVEKGIMGYSPKQLQYIAMLWKSTQ